MTKHEPTRKLTPEGLQLTLRMYAEGLTTTEIVKYLEENKMPHPTRQAINDLVKSAIHQATINEFREAFMARVMDIPIANKRVRIDDLELMRKRLKKSMEAFISTEGKVNIKKVSKYLSMAKRLKEIIDSARDEIEKKPLIQVSQTTITSLEELKEHEKSITNRLLQLSAGGVRLSDPGEGKDQPSKETP